MTDSADTNATNPRQKLPWYAKVSICFGIITLLTIGVFIATGKPVILGINEIGETLTVDMSGVDDPDGMLNPPAFQYRWTAGGTYLANQTSPEIDLTQIHSGKYIIVEVRFRDAGGYSETVHSDPFGPIGSSSRQPITPEPTPEPTITPTIVATPSPTIAPTKVITPTPTTPAPATLAPTATPKPTRRAVGGGGGGGGTITDSGDDDPTPTPTPEPALANMTVATPTPTPNVNKPDGPRTFIPVTPTAIFTPTPSPAATVTPTPIRPTPTRWGWLPIIRPTEEPTATPPPTTTPEPTLTPMPELTTPPDYTVPPEEGFNWWWIIGLLIAAGSAAAAYAAYKQSDRFHDFVNAGARSISDRLGR